MSEVTGKVADFRHNEDHTKMRSTRTGGAMINGWIKSVSSDECQVAGGHGVQVIRAVRGHLPRFAGPRHWDWFLAVTCNCTVTTFPSPPPPAAAAHKQTLPSPAPNQLHSTSRMGPLPVHRTHRATATSFLLVGPFDNIKIAKLFCVDKRGDVRSLYCNHMWMRVWSMKCWSMKVWWMKWYVDM